MARTKVLLSGVRDLKTAQAAEKAGADAVGFDFRPGSPRHVDPFVASDILSSLPPMLWAVAIYADPTLDDFLDAEAVFPAPYTQLAGNEKDNLVRRIGPDVIKTVTLDLSTLDAELRRWSRIEEACAVSLDAPAGFDWDASLDQLSRSIKLSPLRVIITGGLTPENVGGVLKALRPWGVGQSLAESPETLTRFAQFCEAVRRADVGA